MPKPSPREIRIFLSSTFNDMQQERDYLIKKIFPSIKAECSRRGVDFTVLDLRWGITPQEATSGRVVEICLDEIERTRPYFIGLLGGRYGWIPAPDDSAVNERLLNRYPWIDSDISSAMSITEIEMRFGALRATDDMNAFFYLRDLKSVAKRHLDAEGTIAAAKRDALRRDILSAAGKGLRRAATYRSVKKLGQRVYADIMEMVNSRFPERKIPTVLDRVAAEQERMLDELTKVYVPVGNVLENILQQAVAEKQILKISGEKGVGKSASVAHLLPMTAWHKIGSSGYFEVVHTFLGGKVTGSDMALRMLVHSLAQNDPDMETPGLDDFSTEPNFRAILKTRNPDKPPVLWILDGLENFSLESDAAMEWVNQYKPYLGGLILITADDILGEGARGGEGSMSELRRHVVLPLNPTEVSKIVDSYLRTFAKGLTIGQRDAIGNNQNMQNPAMLRIFLDELLQFGIFEKLDEFIASYLEAADRRVICGLVIQRMEDDFGADTVKEILCLLRILPRGVEEEMFIKELGLKNLEWAPIRAALVGFSVAGDGLFRLADEDFINAVDIRYHPAPEQVDELQQTALRILKRTMKLYQKQTKGWWKVFGWLVAGDGGAFLYSHSDQAFMDKVRACATQQLHLNLERRNLDEVYRWFKNKYSIVVRAEELSMLCSSEIFQSSAIDLSRFVEYRDILLPSLSPGLTFASTLIIQDPTGQQRAKLEKKIRRMPLPGSKKREAYKSISALYDAVNLTVDELLSSEANFNSMTIWAKIISILGINVVSTLDRIINNCEALLRDRKFDKYDISEKSVLLLVAAFAALRKGDIDLSQSYQDRLEDDTIQNRYQVLFLKALTALKRNDEVAARTAVGVFRKMISKYADVELFNLCDLWIKELAEDRGIPYPFETAPSPPQIDENLWTLGIGLYYDGVSNAVTYLKMILERPNVDDWNKHIAAYHAACSFQRDKIYDEAAKYFILAGEYYRKSGYATPDFRTQFNLVKTYRLADRFEDYCRAFDKLINEVDKSKLTDEEKNYYLQEITHWCRWITLKIADDCCYDAILDMWSVADDIEKNTMYNCCLAMYATMLKPNEPVVDDETFEEILQDVRDKKVYSVEVVRDAILDFMVFRNQHERANEIQKEWFGEIKRPIPMPDNSSEASAAENA